MLLQDGLGKTFPPAGVRVYQFNNEGRNSPEEAMGAQRGQPL